MGSANKSIGYKLMRSGAFDVALAMATPECSTAKLTARIEHWTGIKFNAESVSRWRRQNGVPANRGGNRYDRK